MLSKIILLDSSMPLTNLLKAFVQAFDLALSTAAKAFFLEYTPSNLSVAEPLNSTA